VNNPARVVFLGGLGEIGRNMIAVESSGRVLVIDCGLSFPTEEMLGVDLVLPDFAYLEDRDIEAVVLTHGHEDHVGALAWFLQRCPAPVYGTPLTLGIARRRLEEQDVSAEMHEISAPESLSLGPFECRFLAVSHSIPEAVAVVLDTDAGRILYTSDFKLDQTPIDGRKTDLEGFRKAGDEGVDLLLSDSTNALSPGRTPSESILTETLREIIDGAQRRVIVACFASNLHRVQQICELAEASGRNVAFVGRSMVANVEVGRELGHIKISDDTIIDINAIENYPPERTAIVCTGAQGEPLSALALISAAEHKKVRVQRGDTVILSASPIPGNEPAVHRVLNAFHRAGADVYDPEIAPVHVSGHGASEELFEMLTTVRPMHFTPVHGEFRHLIAHKRIAVRAGMPEESISIVEDGGVLELDGGRVRLGEKIPVGLVLVDGLGVGDVGPVVLRDRRHLAEDGILICVVTIDSQTGEVLAGPDLISRGFVHIEESRDFLDDAAEETAEALDELEGVTDWGEIKRACRRALGEYVWQHTGRRPMILPVVMEV